MAVRSGRVSRFRPVRLETNEVRLHVASKRRTIRDRIAAWRKAAGKKHTAMRRWNWAAIVKVAALICLLAGIGVFLRYAEGVVRSANAGETGSLILVEVPSWVSWDLKLRVAEVAGGSRFPIGDDTAEVVTRNLASMAWLDDVKVQVTYDAVRVKARWRKPVALLHKDSIQFYVDGDLVVLDYIAMPHLPIVEVKGVAVEQPPKPGERFDRGDLAAAVELISLLDRADAQFSPKTPLLEQIARVDVSNYKGRKSAKEPHIILNTKGDTQVIWGAEIGEWARHLEAKDEQKLAGLYAYYKKFGSLSTDVKYINVRDPQDRVPQPIDRYR
jgi:hypothetical protein